MKVNLFQLFLFCFISPLILAQQSKKPSSESPIGVFDSGTGGLTVLEAILKLDVFNNETGAPVPDGRPDFENENFQYLADQANMPYGNYAAENKTELLREHILKNIDFLMHKSYYQQDDTIFTQKVKSSVKMIVVACNTATAYALPQIQFHLNKQAASSIPVIGVIDAGSKAALQAQQKNGNGLIGVFATAGTVASNGYPRTLNAIAKTMGIAEPLIISQGGLGLAESIDRDWAYISDTSTHVRKAYKGPSITNSTYPILLNWLNRYRFDTSKGKILCEYDANGKCLDIQLNDPVNYVRFHLVSLLEKLISTKPKQKLNTLILGCTHYPYLKDTIAAVLKELYQLKIDDEFIYQNVMDKEVTLIDPAIETAKEAYVKLHTAKNKNGIKNGSKKFNFFISVPNILLPGIELQKDGWFTYNYKYGRKAGERKEYVKIVPFSDKNIPSSNYQRFKETLPFVYRAITKK